MSDTALIDFDSDFGTVTETAPVITEQVIVRPVVQSIPSVTFALKPDAEWGWEELRDYVVNAIEQRHGEFPRNFKTEHSIFKSFLSRWGTQAPAIARTAFEHFDGMWKGAPIGVNRFCKASDQFFAQVIADRL
jgi:hypothetical protein